MTLIMGIVAVLGVVHLAEDPGFERGLTLRVWDVGRPMDFLAEIAPDQTPNVDRRVDEVNFTHATDFGSPPDYFVVELSGLINITKPGDYTFSLSSDDGSQLEIDDTLVIDHDGIHPFAPKVGSIRLAEGTHPILIRMFESRRRRIASFGMEDPGEPVVYVGAARRAF